MTYPFLMFWLTSVRYYIIRCKMKNKPSFDNDLFKLVLSMKEGLPYQLLRKEVGKYVKTLTPEQKQDLLNRRDEIMENWLEWKESNFWVLQKIGFEEAEADILQDKRLDSPGMRRVMVNRAVELGYLKESPLQ